MLSVLCRKCPYRHILCLFTLLSFHILFYLMFRHQCAYSNVNIRFFNFVLNFSVFPFVSHLPALLLSCLAPLFHRISILSSLHLQQCLPPNVLLLAISVSMLSFSLLYSPYYNLNIVISILWTKYCVCTCMCAFACECVHLQVSAGVCEYAWLRLFEYECLSNRVCRGM